MDEKSVKRGGVSVDTEHIFPVIKKWLYSEKEIFLRELVSNACDAITKLKRLSSLGQYEEDGAPYRITVSFNKSDKTLTVTDNGIGMTADEVEQYLGNMAISGAIDFIKRYEGEGESGTGIIGHFGLGFYSAFMVADQVEVLTASYTSPEHVTHWACDESGAYELAEGAGHARGTSVIMHINEDAEEYLNEGKLRGVLNRYCAFMPVEIYLEDEEAETPALKEGEEPKAPVPVNDTMPLWQKRPSDCTDEEYIDFYRKVFDDYREPLFWLHINADYPLNFKGILYFPKLREQYESLEGKVKLYYNQVFVADNIKEVIPEYLLTVRGVLDCPELPLNVSRSYLQNNTYVNKVSAHIIKKVADKLNSMAGNDREKYETLWNDIRTFVEYGCISDRKFYDRAAGAVLLPLSEGGAVTLDEYLTPSGEAADGAVKDMPEQTVYYATDKDLQSQYISLYTAKGYRVVMLPTPIDVHYAEVVERNRGHVKFLRVDADTEALKGEEAVTDSEALEKLFSSLAKEGQSLKVEVVSLADRTVPAVVKISEEDRRMQEMMRMYAPDAPSMPLAETLVVNAACPLVERLVSDQESDRSVQIARQIYRLARLSQRALNAEEMKDFLDDSYALLSLL